ncbi:hypothetical protein UFOVP1008_51 [uncultured Caudovirales phage]|uniref:Uncharacterized protein n=1 Tax=uncultured Caudovirales phage TaxID=2100421 RepID=A0A6J5ML76_9CAUD|nr:hypothetical protein UFOVP498_6 [uncultured Caudovirales phage]CAB4177788.1 hypothetical protein UFOVP1008_51 [uncultured Caudovirales phage]CAB4187509.1 hypothetical protein UFOVP1160_48 [uncultured Caudovirales phage]CAB4199605.1 hypothetical protein UFOVP1352_2 [uncultured Caudovirales phage]
MAFTFGAATGDDITWTETGSPWGQNQRSGLVAGWYYPTALTAGLALWSFGTVHRAALSATSGEIDVFFQRATTNTQYTTSGLGLAVNQWHFIAILMNNFNTGVVTTWKVWRSVDTDIPSAVTINVVTAGVGTVTSSVIPTIGNLGSAGTSAFQGDIGRFDFLVETIASSFVGNTSGAIGTESERRIFEDVVLPIWGGNSPTFFKSGTSSNGGITHTIVDLDRNGDYGRSVRNGGTIVTRDRTVAISGATPSLSRAPIPTIGPVSWPDFVRR